jgi:hypothetical protein
MSYELQTPTESKRKFKSIYGWITSLIMNLNDTRFEVRETLALCLRI